MATKKVIDLLVTAITSGGWFEITIPDGSGGYFSRRISYATLESAVNAGNLPNKGYFATEVALNAAYPVGENGWYAIVGDTDTVWVWDDDSSAWVDSGAGGVVTSVNGQTGAVSLTATDIPFSSAQGLLSTDVGSAIDELKVYIDAQIASSGLYVADYRSYEETVTAGANTLVFKDSGGNPAPMGDTDYEVIVDDVTGCGVNKTTLSKTVNGFSVNCLASGTIRYIALRSNDNPTSITDDDAIHDNVAGEIAALDEKASPISGDWIMIEDTEDLDTGEPKKKKIQIGNLPLTGASANPPIVAAFTDGDLVAGVYTITHNQGTENVELSIYLDGVLEDISGMMTIVNSNQVTVDFGGSIGSATGKSILKYYT